MSSTVTDGVELQVIVSSPDQIPNRHFEQGESSTVAGVSDITPQVDLGSLKQELAIYILMDKQQEAKSIFDKFPEMVRTPLTDSGDTALHVAVSTNNVGFVQMLVKLMNPEDLQIPNADGNTAFCMAAILGKGNDCFRIMTQENANLPLITGHDGMLPVHLAAFLGHRNIVRYLTSEDLFDSMGSNLGSKDVERLFFMTISNNMYDVATKLLDKYSVTLAMARDDQEGLTALHMLAQKPPEEYYTQEENNEESSSSRRAPHHHELQLFEMLWYQVRQFEQQQILELVTKPSSVLFDAVKSGNEAAAELVLSMYPQLLKIKDTKTGRNVLHFAVLYRRKFIFNFILHLRTVNFIIAAVDNAGNNVLHLAPQYQPQNELTSSLRPSIQMRREIEWFKEVENKVPIVLRTMKNKEGNTPMDVLRANQKFLSKQVKYSAVRIANSDMIVATLITTVAFAAALTVPGDKTGNNVWFIVFVLTNALAVLTSSASIISFLSIFTSSRFTESEFVILLHPSLILGLTLLFISIATMVIALVAALFLVFAHKSKWVPYVVASLAPLPILLFPLLHIDLLIDYYYFYRRHRLLRIW